MNELWKVGELAALTGLTIRTLRYYDQIQLFSPSEYTESGHRLYTKSDLIKLQQILSLKHIGLSLDEIQSIMHNKEYGSATNIIEAQIARIKEDIQVQQNLLNELESALETVNRKKYMSIDQLTTLLAAMKMNQEKYFTRQQLVSMRNYYDQLDEDSIKELEQQYKVILDELRLKMKKGTAPNNNSVRELAKKWSSITNAFTGGDPDIKKQAEKFYAENPNNALQFGLDAKMYNYIKEALR